MHAGWGDKYKESPRTAIDTYVAAVDRLLADRPRHPSREVPIFVVTEDYTALEAFQQAVVLREGWVVYTHPAAILQASHGADAPTGEKRKKNEKKHKHKPKTRDELSPVDFARRSSGALGLESLVSLILALEARSYVLTIASNWGRLIEEARRAAWLPRCGQNCTRMVAVGAPPHEEARFASLVGAHCDTSSTINT